MDERGIRPTPFYDMLCIIAHENVEHNLAMAYGDEFNPNEVKAYQLREFSDEIDVNYKLVSQNIDKLASLIIKALKGEIVSSNELLEEESVFIEKLKSLILQRAEEFKVIASEMNSISY